MEKQGEIANRKTSRKLNLAVRANKASCYLFDSFHKKVYFRYVGKTIFFTMTIKSNINTKTNIKVKKKRN